MEVTMKKLLLLTLLFSAPALQVVGQVPSLFDVTARAMANYDLDQFSRLDLKNKSLPEELEDKLKKELQPMLWQFADIKKRLQGHTAAVFSVAISPDTRFIVTGSYDNTARIVSITHLINTLSLEQLMFIKTLQNHAKKHPNGFQLTLEQAELFYTLPGDLPQKLVAAYMISVRLSMICGNKRKRS